MTNPTNPVEVAAELPMPEGIDKEAGEAVKAWVQGIVDARVLDLVPALNEALAARVVPGTKAAFDEFLRKSAELFKDFAADRDDGEAWKRGPLHESE